jgi:methionyl-tRNA synthetase
MTREKVLVTAALPYINNVPHMGHIVGSHLPADIFFRYCRAQGMDAILIGGSDEHGTPSAVVAKQMGLHPQQLVDKLHDIHCQVYRRLNIDYTNYSRTSNPLHHKVVQDFFRKIYDAGYTHHAPIDMYYCEHDRMFLPDRFVVGTCPKCDYESANADQCENCTTVLGPNELIEPKCKSCGTEPVIRKSEHIYFELDKLSQKLDTWIDSQRSVWRPHVYSEAKKWINEGLRSRSITRDLEWGIKVHDQGLADKVFYVWFDAPIGYISFTKELGEETFEKYWRDPDSKIVHFLGKDNIPFHTVFWPAMLMAHEGLNLPTNVVGYNYLNFEGQKFSKSKGVGVFCYNLLDSDIDIDALRSYLTMTIPERKDADFKWEGFKTTTNADLIGKLGNFFNRTLNLIWKNFDGQLDYSCLTDISDIDRTMIEAIHNEPTAIGNQFFGAEIRDAYKRIMQYATIGNVYLDRTAPWNLLKEQRVEEAKKSLYLSLNLCKSLAIVSSPIVPESMQKLWREQLCMEGRLTEPGIWSKASTITLTREHRINKPEPLYARIDDKKLADLEQQFAQPHSLDALVSGSHESKR